MDSPSGAPPGHDEVTGEYQYQTLDRNVIRAFRIQPADDFDAQLRGDIVTIILTKEGASAPYNALSYCWGRTHADGSHLSASLMCDGLRLAVTPSLDSGLRHIRAYGYRQEAQILGNIPYETDNIEAYRHFASRPIWIDAICINQNDLQERARQVEMMASIFSHSASVLVWLGKLSARAMKLYNRASAPVTRIESPPSATSPSTVRSRASSTSSWQEITPLHRSLITQPHIDSEDSDIIPGLRQILEELRLKRHSLLKWIIRRPWFQRRWVLQEMLYALDCFLLADDFVCSRSHMRTMLEEAGELNRAPPLQPHDSSCSLLEACWLFDNSDCTNPHDRIFALKHMSEDGVQVDVDYRTSVRDTYVQMLLDTVLALDTARVLHYPRRVVLGEQMYTRNDVYACKTLQMLAIATCKPRTIGQNRRYEMEGWSPDWRCRNVFKSQEHQKAVELCMSPLLHAEPDHARVWSLPDGTEFTDSAYCYLRVRSTLFVPKARRTSEPWSKTPWPDWERFFSDSEPSAQQRERVPIKSRLANLNDVLLRALPKERRLHDRIWISHIRDRSLLVGFVLREGITCAAYKDLPVYSLHSCFVAHGETYDQAYVPPAVPWPRELCLLDSFYALGNVEFLLE